MNKNTDRLIVIASYLAPYEADLTRLRLEAEGIPAVLDGEHHVAMDWAISNAIGGVKVLVHSRHHEDAKRILGSDADPVTDELTGDVTEKETSI